MKKLLICLTVLFSAFLFTNSINAEDLGVEITVNSSVYEIDHFVSYTDIFYEYTIYETLKNYDIDVSDYKYIIINNYGGQRNIMIYLFNDLFTFIDVDNRTGGISKSLRAAPSGINYTVLKYNYDNTVEKIGKYTSNGINSSSLANWYFNDGYFMLSLATSSRISYSNYDTGITGTYSSVQNVLTLPEPKPESYNIILHLNGGVAWDTNEVCDDIGCYIVGNQYEDYTINVPGDNLISYLADVYITKEPMQFVGWYYDEKLTQKVNSTDTIDSDKHFYAKYEYKNVEDFLNNTTFNSYTFDENYQYAVISLNNQQNRDIYLGLNIMSHNLEVYKYSKETNTTIKGSTMCLTPIFSKNDKYYYYLDSPLNSEYEVLVIPKDKLKGNYNFLLSNNAYVTYTNDLKSLVIKDDDGNDLTIDIEDSYNYSQDNLLNSENDLLEIFKDLINNKDNNVFSYFNQVWNLMKTNKLFTYFMCLIIGSLIVLIIKAASR